MINQHASSLSVVTALVLAGGRGTRIAALYPDLPKPMVPVAGMPFLEWLMRRLVNQRVRNVVLSIGYRADSIMAWNEKRQALSDETVRCLVETQPLGTGGAVAFAVKHIPSPITVVLNGDTLFFASLASGIEKLNADNANNFDGIVFARSVADASRYGSLQVANGRLVSFQEKQPGRGLINGGIYAFKTEWLRNQIGEGAASMEAEIIPRMLSRGARIGMIESDAPFIDIGTPESLAEADQFVLTHKEYF